MLEATALGEKVRVLKAKGDGNCGPRAIIQSLLVQGILQDKKELAINFISELINRTEIRVRDADGLDKPAAFSDFFSQYKELTIDELNNFSEDFFISKVSSEILFSNESEEEINRLLDGQHQSKLTEVVNRIAPPIHNSAKNDSILYFLAACLRKDASLFFNDEESMTLGEAEPTLDQLNSPIAIDDFDPYLKHHKIQLTLNTDLTKKYIYGASNQEFSINLTYGSDHFNAFLFEKDFTKRLQIEQDGKLAKALQIEEIKLFSEKFKTSENIDRLFIRSLIENLGLKDKLETEELGKLHSLKSFSIMEQALEVLYFVIDRLGYSSFFKEELKKQTRDYSTAFFTKCSQAETLSNSQTPSSPPILSIKCT